MADREGIVKDLTAFVKKFYPTATLTLFGSSVNGFSFARSDLDLSLTFEDHPTDENLNSIGKKHAFKKYDQFTLNTS